MGRFQSVIEMFCLCVGARLHMSCFVVDMKLPQSRLPLWSTHDYSSRPCSHLAQEPGPPRVALRASSHPVRRGQVATFESPLASPWQNNGTLSLPLHSCPVRIVGIIVTCHSEMADCLICPGDLPLSVSCPCRLIPPLGLTYHCYSS